jgi:outer membrane biogenesis lipoprotein LolB
LAATVGSFEAGYPVHRCLPIVAALLLAGCAASGSPRQDQQPVQAAAAQPNDDAACQSQGFTPGSPDYVQCRKQLDKQHEKDEPADNWTQQRENTVRALLGRPPF